jgi:hypothetical protein
LRRSFLRHPRWDAGDRVVGLRDDDQFNAAIGESPAYQHGLAAPGMERIVDPTFERVFLGSMSLFREEAGRP